MSLNASGAWNVHVQNLHGTWQQIQKLRLLQSTSKTGRTSQMTAKLSILNMVQSGIIKWSKSFKDWEKTHCQDELSFQSMTNHMLTTMAKTCLALAIWCFRFAMEHFTWQQWCGQMTLCGASAMMYLRSHVCKNSLQMNSNANLVSTIILLHLCMSMNDTLTCLEMSRQSRIRMTKFTLTRMAFKCQQHIAISGMLQIHTFSNM